MSLIFDTDIISINIQGSKFYLWPIKNEILNKLDFSQNIKKVPALFGGVIFVAEENEVSRNKNGFSFSAFSTEDTAKNILLGLNDEPMSVWTLEIQNKSYDILISKFSYERTLYYGEDKVKVNLDGFLI